MPDKSFFIEKYLRRLGAPFLVERADGATEAVVAVLQRFWRRNRSKFENVQYKIGRNYKEYYQYIGPPSYDITGLCEDDFLICDGIRYFFVSKEAVRVGGKIQYYTGVLKQVREENDELNEAFI